MSSANHFTFDLKTARGYYLKAQGDFKTMLEEQYTIEGLTTIEIYDRVKSYEDAKALVTLDEDDIEGRIAMDMMLTIRKALVQDWEADYANPNQKKWYPYFIYDKSLSAFRLDGTGYGYGATHSILGARLVFPDEKMARYFGSHPPFLEIINKFLLIKYKPTLKLIA